MNFLAPLAALPAPLPTPKSGFIVNPALNPAVGTGEGIPILQLFLTNFITLALGAAGVITFFMLLAGGIQYITAGGEIVFSIFAIIYIAETLFGISIREFTIPIIN
ncbi:MAG: hypothetical protein UX52_C0017G0011 [Candidatus Amesbacteria bacterium GW2011_GWA1_46_35]|nr:MAG: hypothetical protein UX52_C0017G0011 [Candidatus Amesbacteria bacterium GW2011_GWA1_46_35]